jgi:hypothetical protein
MHSSNYACIWGDCINLTYQCLDSREGYHRLRTVYCDTEKHSKCGSATCGTRCVEDGDPIMCPVGTVCELRYRGTGIPRTYPEDACQPLPDGGLTKADAEPVDAATKETGSN